MGVWKYVDTAVLPAQILSDAHHSFVETCQANPTFKVTSIATYDENLKQYADWFVGYDSKANEIIVSLADIGQEELYVVKTHAPFHALYTS